MTTLLENAAPRGVVVLSASDRRDQADLLGLQDAPDARAVLCLVPADVDPPARVQEAWYRLAARRSVVVLRHDEVWRSGADPVSREAARAVCAVARWTASRGRPGLRMMLLEPPSAEVHGFRIRGNVEVVPLEEGLRMTLAPDAPLPDPDVEPVPTRDPDTTDPDDVPEVPLEPVPAPDETGIR